MGFPGQVRRSNSTARRPVLFGTVASVVSLNTRIGGKISFAQSWKDSLRVHPFHVRRTPPSQCQRLRRSRHATVALRARQRRSRRRSASSLRDAGERPALVTLRKAEAEAAKSPFEQVFGLEGGFKRNALVVLAWMAGGTCLYWLDGFEEQESNRVVQSFYYMVQSLLSIGFGVLTPRSEWSMLVSVGLIFVGAALAANFLSGFLADAVDTMQKKPSGKAKDASDTSFLVLWGALATWWLIGILFGRYHEGWSWTRSLLFAMSATSTAGMQGVDTVDDSTLLFCSFYCLVGVPLFASAIGRMSLMIAERTLESRHSQIRQRAVRILKNCSEECMCDVFDMYDEDGDGTVSGPELEGFIKFLANSEGMVVTDDDISYFMAEFDKDGDGSIGVEEFKAAAKRWVRENDT